MYTINMSTDAFTAMDKYQLSALLQANESLGKYNFTQQLEQTMAAQLGKEKALFVPTGYMGNLIAVIVHCNRGDTVLVERNSHIARIQHAAISSIAGVTLHCLAGKQGMIQHDTIEQQILAATKYSALRLVCLENPHHYSGGSILSLDELHNIRVLLERKNIALHMDGARLFHASFVQKLPLNQFAESVDSVMVNFNKSYNAPLGAIIAGPAIFIDQARKWRKMLGGTIHKSDLMAATCLAALHHAGEWMADNHRMTEWLAQHLRQLPGIEVNENSPFTNIITLRVRHHRTNAVRLYEQLGCNGVKINLLNEHTLHMVVHREIQESHLERLIFLFAEILK
ncbi:threonine aldolase family protein [Paenibacillus tyrfis]|uniref:threonine aldolase family protein n=1 Tax=Paenibacillus tyrfis TaxID=1501230 RepID=UPI0020A1EB55|nr:GntG family PLP-dependent aldolase [Paenibacillus tyrfis]MCP1311574.1 aminotransferase class I/II-fold pyridoxal phosphate-dependent enzyme [Paenibacillus tyrfis]